MNTTVHSFIFIFVVFLLILIFFWVHIIYLQLSHISLYFFWIICIFFDFCLEGVVRKDKMKFLLLIQFVTLIYFVILTCYNNR